MTTAVHDSRSTSAYLLATLATISAGIALATQGALNGALTGVLGAGVFAATVSFLTGLVILVVVTLVTPSARAGVARVRRAVRSGEFPLWMTLGGVGGTTVVISQGITIPLMGVAVFTMALVAGQLTGALVVDNTSLPPGGRKPPTVWRVGGTLVVLAGVSMSAIGVFADGIPLWAPLLPFLAGAVNSVQQATNGRLRMQARSAIAANLANFAAGAVFLVLVSAVMILVGTPPRALPDMSTQWWMLLGGPLGVIVIGVTAVTVLRLGVLLLSLVSLFGNLVGSLVIDLTFPSSAAPVDATTYVSMALVAAGVVLANVQKRRALPGPGVREDSTAEPGPRRQSVTD